MSVCVYQSSFYLKYSSASLLLSLTRSLLTPTPETASNSLSFLQMPIPLYFQDPFFFFDSLYILIVDGRDHAFPYSPGEDKNR